MAVTLRALGFDKAAIRSYMNWKSDTMPDYYSNIRDQMTTTAPAITISKNENIESIQETLIWVQEPELKPIFWDSPLPNLI